MPIEFRIDDDARLVTARATGVLRETDLFDYQGDVWSRPGVAGYDELIDMTEAEEIEFSGGERARQLAGISAEMDDVRGASKLAIVAPTDYVFALARMYETYRTLNPKNRAQVGVFRTVPAALEFLGRRP